LLAGQREYESSFARHIRIPFDRQYCHSPQMNPALSRDRFGGVFKPTAKFAKAEPPV
jgi:hypothetical protein